jgi:hypothetical protein
LGEEGEAKAEQAAGSGGEMLKSVVEGRVLGRRGRKGKGPLNGMERGEGRTKKEIGLGGGEESPGVKTDSSPPYFV